MPMVSEDSSSEVESKLSSQDTVLSVFLCIICISSLNYFILLSLTYIALSPLLAIYVA